MRKLFPFLVMAVLPIAVKADFSAQGGLAGTPYDYIPSPGSGLSHVFVYYGMDGASLCFVCDNPSDCRWEQYVSAYPSQAVPVESTSSATASTISGVEGGRGYVVTYGGIQYSCYVIDYKSVLYSYSELVPASEANDVCESLQVAVHGSFDDLTYYTPAGKRCGIERTHTFRYIDKEWDEQAKSYVEKEKSMTADGVVSAFVVDAPLDDTEFTIEGDQFATWFGVPKQTSSATYEGVKVKQYAIAETDDEKAEISETKIKGQAPLTVHFTALQSPATDYTTWYLYIDKEDKEKYLYRTESEIDYTFEVSGTFSVKLIVSNDVCRDSVTFDVTITESSLECPNFFSPRSTPGENDLFRVAYKSIISFHGRIMNRWGVTLFEWTDPDEGWDGTYNGTAVNPGVYFYIITAKGSDGEEYSLKGDINLLE